MMESKMGSTTMESALERSTLRPIPGLVWLATLLLTVPASDALAARGVEGGTTPGSGVATGPGARRLAQNEIARHLRDARGLASNPRLSAAYCKTGVDLALRHLRWAVQEPGGRIPAKALRNIKRAFRRNAAARAEEALGATMRSAGSAMEWAGQDVRFGLEEIILWRKIARKPPLLRQTMRELSEAFEASRPARVEKATKEWREASSHAEGNDFWTKEASRLGAKANTLQTERLFGGQP